MKKYYAIERNGVELGHVLFTSEIDAADYIVTSGKCDDGEIYRVVEKHLIDPVEYAKHLAEEDFMNERYTIDDKKEFTDELVSSNDGVIEEAYNAYQKELERIGWDGPDSDVPNIKLSKLSPKKVTAKEVAKIKNRENERFIVALEKSDLILASENYNEIIIDGTIYDSRLFEKGAIMLINFVEDGDNEYTAYKMVELVKADNFDESEEESYETFIGGLKTALQGN